MAEVIVSPDVELWATGYLRAALAARPEPYSANVYISRKVPDPRRNRMVIVRWEGGPGRDVVLEDGVLSVRVFASTEQEAADLARLVRALLLASAGAGAVKRTRGLGGPYEVPDESGQPLRFFTVELTIRGSA